MTTGQPGTGNARPTPSGATNIRPTTPPAAGTPTPTTRTVTSAPDPRTVEDRPLETVDTAATADHPTKDAAQRDPARDDAAKDGPDRATTLADDPKGGTAKEYAPKPVPAKDTSAEDGATKDGAAKDGAAKDGAAKDGAAKDGAAKDGATKDGATKDGAAKDGATEVKAAKGETADDADGAGKPVGTERWEAFASAPEPAPTRRSRAARAVGRFLVHEWTLATLGALALAVLMTWPTLRYPLYTLPQDYWDPSLQAWQMAWSGHILLADPAHLWQSNTFFPELWSFAFSDTLLGYAPAGMLGSGPEDAVLRYNIMFVLAHALATLGAYALARQLGAGRIGAAVAGVGYTYAPWLLAQAGHLHVLSNGGIPLALAMLARGHGWSLRHGYRPERRHDGWVYSGWLVAAWQLSLGFGIGLPFAYFLAGAVLVAAVLFVVRRLRTGQAPPFGRRLLVADLVGGALFAGVGLLMAIPFFKVTELHPYAERTIGDISLFSPPATGFVTAPAESRIWGGLHEGARAALPWHPEMTLLPGFVLYALAAGGLFFSVWRLRHRLLLLAGVLVTMAFAMGTRFFDGSFTYVPLFEHAPGWSALRTPGRLMLWTTLLLGLLAAGAVTALTDRVRELAAQRIPSWPGPWLRLATLLPLLLVTVEGLNITPHPVVPTQPAALRTVEGPMLVLPSNQSLDQHVMLWSTSRFQDVVNGGSGFTPHQLDDVRRVTQSFPDQTSVDYLRTLGVRNVVLLRGQVAGTPWEFTIDAPVESLGIARQEIDGAVVYRL
ncbi:pentapeptide MXKDX repeat protein [Micromonospora sp. CPCC 205539]|uniref:pentapeptide MXKDX repeat protein n=1 Tax=Micromonospora sp. CPCC 205539 TaxID=3122408 RepID=UPI002FF2A458